MAASKNDKETAVLHAVYAMATESLPPDDFEEIERILKELSVTRGLGFKTHGDYLKEVTDGI